MSLKTQVFGIDINYICEGSGDFVVLLHGWGSNITLFNSMIDVLKTKYTVIAPDMPGFGGSGEPEEPWDVSKYVDFVIEFLKPFNIKSLTLLGHSFGGRVILKMFERGNLPFKIERIILADSAGVKPKKTLKQKIKLYSYKLKKNILN